MQQAVQPETINIQWIWSEFTGKLSEFLLDFFGNPHIKDAFHQRLNREEMGIDVLQISHGLLQRIC